LLCRFPMAPSTYILCQFGLQFFPDKPAALGEMRRVLAPSGRVALSVFTAIEHPPASNALADALGRHLGAGASQTKRSEHVLSDRRELRELVTAAEFRNVAIESNVKAPRRRFRAPARSHRLCQDKPPVRQAGEGSAGEISPHPLVAARLAGPATRRPCGCKDLPSGRCVSSSEI
jgi:ubiE/COQ5 methyltransferase family